MPKYFVPIIILVVLFLSACTVYVNGIPYEIEVAMPFYTPTAEYATSIYTPVPTTTATPLATSTPYGCRVAADSSINMRRVPGGEKIYVISPSDVLTPDVYTTWNNLRYYGFYDLPKYGGTGWAADFFTEQGNCEIVPLVSPF